MGFSMVDSDHINQAEWTMADIKLIYAFLYFFDKQITYTQNCWSNTCLYNLYGTNVQKIFFQISSAEWYDQKSALFF